MQAAGAQGAEDVGFKRKAAEDNKIYVWQNDERAFQVQVKQFQRNEDVKTKMLAGAEAAVVKTKGVAESKVIAADADIKKAEAAAIRLGADGKKRLDYAEANKIEADAHKIEADAEKTKAEAALLQFELDQKKKAAGNAPVVPVAIFNKSNTTKPLTEQQKLNKSNKAKQERLDAKKFREGLVPV